MIIKRAGVLPYSLRGWNTSLLHNLQILKHCTIICTTYFPGVLQSRFLWLWLHHHEFNSLGIKNIVINAPCVLGLVGTINRGIFDDTGKDRVNVDI